MIAAPSIENPVETPEQEHTANDSARVVFRGLVKGDLLFEMTNIRVEEIQNYLLMLLPVTGSVTGI